MNLINIEIISVVRNKNAVDLADKKPELRERLDKYGYTLTDVKNTVLRGSKIKSALNEIAKSDNRPDVVIIANALSTKDSSSFRKYFVETVAEAERSENDPTPKNYWKNNIFLIIILDLYLIVDYKTNIVGHIHLKNQIVLLNFLLFFLC